jgi:hypothetical protein
MIQFKDLEKNKPNPKLVEEIDKDQNRDKWNGD